MVKQIPDVRIEGTYISRYECWWMEEPEYELARRVSLPKEVGIE